MSFAVRAKSVSNTPRIGVFGGTFDPIHLGHLAIARTAKTQAGLDKVLFVVAADPPHKTAAVSSAKMRAAMTAAALEGEAGFELCRIELDRPGPSYTVDTLTLLKAAAPGAALFFIVGYDSALDLPKWHQPREILRLATLLIAPRPQNATPLPPLLKEGYKMLVMPEYPLSSSEIRARLRRGETVTEALPPAVARIIQEKRLYQPCR